MNKIGKPLVTQQDVAAAAKVHLSTVSLALRNDPRLPAATRVRVQAVARRLGYIPNPLVSLLMSRVRLRSSGYRGTLGYVHTLEPAALLANKPLKNFFAGAKLRAAQLGFAINEFYLSAGSLSPQRLSALLRARGISGLIVEHSVGPSCPDRTLPFDVSPYAVVTVGVPFSWPALHYVANDQYMRAVVAARELLALGYRRLGMVMHEGFDARMSHRCSAGFWAVQTYAGLAALPICQVGKGQDQIFQDWLRRHRPDAILATDIVTLQAVREMGLRVPEDLGWVHLGWLPDYSPAAGVYGNSKDTGIAAVELVVSQVHRGEHGAPASPVNYLVPGEWIPGKTVRKVGPPMNLDAAFFAA